VSASAEDEPLERQALLRLEGAVGRLLGEMEALRARIRREEARVTEAETLMREVTQGVLDPADLERRVRELDAENADLRARISEGKEGVERLLARIRFLEDQA
jgi:predicted RNase H-like nuclease (RuvC/YqgF family)